MKPEPGLQPKPSGEACSTSWQGGDFIKIEDPQGNQVSSQREEVKEKGEAARSSGSAGSGGVVAVVVE